MSHAQAPIGGYPQSPDPTLSDPQWLQQLSSHPIFTPKQGAPLTDNVGSSTPGSHTRLMTVRGTDLIVVVDNEVRIASLVDAKASASSQPFSPSTSSSIKPAASATYRVLVPAQGSKIDFEIRHLSINPTGKLLACVGDSQITLIVMPRSGYTKHVDREIVCRTVSVAPYYHSEHSNAALSKVDWHPWGENGTSLLVLTEDGLLREYDVAKDTEEPQQTASFLPINAAAASHRSRSRSATPNLTTSAVHTARGFGLSAEDDGAMTAVSFSLCVSDTPLPRATPFEQDGGDEAWAAAASRAKGPSDWSSLTVFGLMKNGDVWALCPFLPRSAVVPAAYIHNLAKLTSQRANSLDSQHTSHVDAQLRYVNALLKQVMGNLSNSSGRSRRQSSVTPGPEAFARSRSTSAMDLDQLVDGAGDGRGEAREEVQDRPVRLHAPSWSYRQDVRQGGGAKKAPRPQGPFLLKPAPVELCDERESAACDIVWTWLTDESADVALDASVPGVASLSIVGHDGRVDVGLLFEPVEAAWNSPSSTKRAASRRRSKPAKTNRYGLSDTEDEADELDALTLEDPLDLPSLLIYETIDLGLLDTAVANGVPTRAAASDLLLEKMAGSRPCFVRDPLYGDTVYVYHAFGAQCLGFATWAAKLIDALNRPAQDELDNEASRDASQIAAQAESREKALVKMLHHGYNTEVVWVVNTVAAAGGEGERLEVNPVTGVSILSDVYLSYAFLAVTADLQVVGVELSLRVEQDPLDSTGGREDASAIDAGRDADRTKAYVSLLGEGPAFQPPAIFANSAGIQGLPSHPRRAGALSGMASKGEVQITPETLRALGKTVENYRHEIRDVVSAGNAVQARLDIQVREMTRQLDKLNSIRLRCGGEGGDKNALAERVHKLTRMQTSLVTRIDRALQRLMDSHQPSVSIYEKRWFEELERIAAEVGVTRTPAGEFKLDTRANRKALAAKAELLAHQLSLLRPQMEKARAANVNSKALGAGATGAREGLLGAEQLNKVEKLLSSEAAMLAEAKDKVQQLNKRIAQLKPVRDLPSTSRTVEGDYSLSFANTSFGLPTSSTAPNLAHLASRHSHSRTGSGFVA